MERYDPKSLIEASRPNIETLFESSIDFEPELKAHLFPEVLKRLAEYSQQRISYSKRQKTVDHADVSRFISEREKNENAEFKILQENDKRLSFEVIVSDNMGYTPISINAKKDKIYDSFKEFVIYGSYIQNPQTKSIIPFKKKEVDAKYAREKNIDYFLKTFMEVYKLVDEEKQGKK